MNFVCVNNQCILQKAKGKTLPKPSKKRQPYLNTERKKIIYR
jgi:hypothetical protein